MSYLEYHLPEEIRQEFRVNDQGQAFLSIRGAARLVGINESSIRKQFEGAGLTNQKTPQILDANTFEGAGLSIEMKYPIAASCGVCAAFFRSIKTTSRSPQALFSRQPISLPYYCANFCP